MLKAKGQVQLKRIVLKKSPTNVETLVHLNLVCTVVVESRIGRQWSRRGRRREACERGRCDCERSVGRERSAVRKTKGWVVVELVKLSTGSKAEAEWSTKTKGEELERIVCTIVRRG